MKTMHELLAIAADEMANGFEAEGRAFIKHALSEHDRRVAELLEANNREVERRRKAEKKVRELQTRLKQLMNEAHGGTATAWPLRST